ncbi:MAG: HPr family phosphocarrier protein [Lachnospiraceae bacterium]|jgi:phosphotransferase system HPr-like phosphotransfer protein
MNKDVQIRLDSIDKIRDFVNTVNRFKTDFDLSSGRYIIDAKSIMGIFSIDLSRELTLTIHDSDEMPEIMEALKPYIV